MKFQTLEGAIKLFFVSHALLGAVGLLILLVPLMSKKGGKLHIRAGWIYVAAMALSGLLALGITYWRIDLDPQATLASRSFALFLAMIAVYTLSSIWYAVAALRAKGRDLKSTSVLHLGPPILMILFSGLTIFIGIGRSDLLLIVFPVFVVLSAREQLNYWLNEPDERQHAWYAHMRGMGTASIATVTAFLVTALPRLWPNPIANSPMVWLAPGLIFGFGLRRWIESYRLKFERPRSSL